MVDPLKQLEAYRMQKQGLEEPKLFGIDRKEAIKIMSGVAEKELEKKKQNKEQLIRMVGNKINIEMANNKRKRATARSLARVQGLPFDPTTSESSEPESARSDNRGRGRSRF